MSGKSKSDRRKSPSSVKSAQRNSVTSDWSENIPVIKISKTESEECILSEENPKAAEGGGEEEKKKKRKRKGRFKETVEKQISNQIKEKEEMSRRLEQKAMEMQVEMKTVAKEEEGGGTEAEESPEKCPIAKEESVSSDLDLSQAEVAGHGPERSGK